MKTLRFACAALVAVVAASPALAEESVSCGNAPRSEWLSKDALKAKAAAMGYDVKNIKVEHGCFEVYALKDGKRVVNFMNPVTAEVVQASTDD